MPATGTATLSALVHGDDSDAYTWIDAAIAAQHERLAPHVDSTAVTQSKARGVMRVCVRFTNVATDAEADAIRDAVRNLHGVAPYDTVKVTRPNHS